AIVNQLFKDYGASLSSILIVLRLENRIEMHKANDAFHNELTKLRSEKERDFQKIYALRDEQRAFGNRNLRRSVLISELSKKLKDDHRDDLVKYQRELLEDSLENEAQQLIQDLSFIAGPTSCRED